MSISYKEQPKGEKISITIISDTHNKHPTVPNSDILIHCGDFTNKGKIEEIESFNEYLSKLKNKLILVVPGNHEVNHLNGFLKKNLKHCVLLEDEVYEYKNLKIYGSKVIIYLSFKNKLITNKSN